MFKKSRYFNQVINKVFYTIKYEGIRITLKKIILNLKDRVIIKVWLRKLFNKFNITYIFNRPSNSVELKKKTLYLHIGWPKTGTSAIQKFMVDNYRVLKKKYDLYYPDYGRWSDGSHHNIAFSLRENPYCQVKTDKEQIEYLKELKLIICKSNCSRILLSSECFNLYNNYNFKKIFKNDFEIKIICYLRIQDAYLESIYGQNVRDFHFKEKRKFNEYMKYFRDNLLYYKILKEWENITSKDNFIIRSYDVDSFFNNNIIDDFLNIFSIKRDKNNFKYIANKENISYNKSVLEYKRLLNMILKEQDVGLIKVLQYYSLEKPDIKQSFLTIKEKNKFNILYKEDNLRIKNRYKNCNFEPKIKYNEEKNDNVFESISENALIDITDFIYRKEKRIFMKILKDINMLTNHDLKKRFLPLFIQIYNKYNKKNINWKVKKDV